MRLPFPSWLRDDLQVVATCLSLDERVPADVGRDGRIDRNTACRDPVQRPDGSGLVGLLGDDFVLNLSYREIERGDLDLIMPEHRRRRDGGSRSESAAGTGCDRGDRLRLRSHLRIDQGPAEPAERSRHRSGETEAPEQDTTVPAYLKKHRTKAIKEVLKKFEQTKEERDQRSMR